jgi:hypothetical protein
MDLSWSTLEDLARTSDDDAIRRRYGARNRVYLTFLLIFFTVVSFIEALSSERHKGAFEVIVAVINLGFTAFGIFFMRYARREYVVPETFMERAGHRLRQHINAAAITFVSVQFLLALLYTRSGNDWFGWAVTFPFFVLGFRMFAPELVLMHSILLGGGLVMSFLAPLPSAKERLPFYISMVVCNLLTLGTEVWFSYRLRKNVSGEWGERRKHAREQIRMRDELRYARELQLSMLPECAPDLAWADICSTSIPATEVGGDYYDYFVDGDRIALVCGDVAGHGMAAGLVLAAMRSGFTLLRDSLHDPATVLRRLQDLVGQTSRRRMLVTVSVVLVDHATQRATIASAGNPPVIHRQADGRVETIDLFAPPLGVRLPVTIPQRTIDIAPGDVLVLHSDGIYETRSQAGEDYGLDRLVRVVQTNGGGTAEELRDAILEDVTHFRGTPEAADDVTIVVCRIV